MRHLLIGFCISALSINAAADALCAANGEKTITTYKYENKGGDYRWINSFLDDLNTFYPRIARNDGESLNTVVQRLSADALALSQKGVNPPEVQCVLELIKTNKLEALAKTHLSHLRLQQEEKAGGELKETFDDFKTDYASCIEDNARNRVIMKKNLASCFDMKLKAIKNEVDLIASRKEYRASDVAGLKGDFNNFIKIQNQRAATVYEKLPAAQIVKRCIYGICVGDNINQHITLIQDIEKNVVRNTERQLKSGQIHYETGERAITDPATKLYLAMEKFERNTLDLLNPTEVFCKRKLRLVGTLQTEKSPIFVTIGQIVAPGQKPYWGIFKIERWYNPPNIADFDKTLRQEFPGFSIGIGYINDQTTASTGDNGLAYVLSLYMSQDDQGYFSNLEDYNVCKAYNTQNI